jgi:4-hydroxy-tetrahydrodipicolinate synthase
MTEKFSPSRRCPFVAEGVIPALLLPFDAQMNIDEAQFLQHLDDVAAVRGVTAVTVNGHSTEVSSCSFDEQQRVLELALSRVGERLPVVAGVYTESTAEAVRLARAADRAGASALLVFIPPLFSGGAAQRPDMVIAHFQRIAEACDLPLILFQFPMASGMGTPLSTLVRLAEAVPTLVAIKDASNNPVTTERQVRELHSLKRPVHVLSSNSSWLLASLVLGCKGILSGAGSTIAPLHVELFDAVQHNDLAAARQAADRLFPVNEAFYADAFLDMHNRMKEAQVLLGRWPSAHVRAPLLRLSTGEISSIELALRQAGLLPH